ncbi:superinfection immunity protein [Formicincola oecophyllae]|uniref:Superinfection immunity protein n=1 Tax=Formicincola oecophyllae TaxID=2558361 RepID=A0A4Y6U8X8_9PROT|nr:superinfection immunity protein [Formicincola oecophyllae]QDH13018.1 superinfection immunity protein [Formicincola oecophyllae]
MKQRKTKRPPFAQASAALLGTVALCGATTAPTFAAPLPPPVPEAATPLGPGDYVVPPLASASGPAHPKPLALHVAAGVESLRALISFIPCSHPPPSASPAEAARCKTPDITLLAKTWNVPVAAVPEGGKAPHRQLTNSSTMRFSLGSSGNPDGLADEGSDVDPSMGMEASFINMAPGHTAMPQLLVSGFTGGAHCCEVTSLYGRDSAGHWRSWNLPMQEGGPPPIIQPVPYNPAQANQNKGLFGTAGANSKALMRAFVLDDEAFFYSFASFASSFAPAVLMSWDPQKGLSTVTRQPAYRAWLQADARRTNAWARHSPPVDEPDGYLAWFVATAANLGRLEEAWQVMLRYEDPKGDGFGMSRCMLDVPPTEQTHCTAEQNKLLPFPQGLAAFLVKQGYITQQEAAHLPQVAVADQERPPLRSMVTAAASVLEAPLPATPPTAVAAGGGAVTSAHTNTDAPAAETAESKNATTTEARNEILGSAQADLAAKSPHKPIMLWGRELTFLQFLLLGVFGLFVYLLPSAIAYARKLPKRALVLLLNVVTGFTIVGWFGALYLALFSQAGRR